MTFTAFDGWGFLRMAMSSISAKDFIVGGIAAGLTIEFVRFVMTEGRYAKILEFGAFISLIPGKDGLLHISQICSERTQKVEDFLAEGQEIDVFVAGVDKQGRVKLEWKNKPQAAGAAVEAIPESVRSSDE